MTIRTTAQATPSAGGPCALEYRPVGSALGASAVAHEGWPCVGGCRHAPAQAGCGSSRHSERGRRRHLDHAEALQALGHLETRAPAADPRAFEQRPQRNWSLSGGGRGGGRDRCGGGGRRAHAEKWCRRRGRGRGGCSEHGSRARVHAERAVVGHSVCQHLVACGQRWNREVLRIRRYSAASTLVAALARGRPRAHPFFCPVPLLVACPDANRRCSLKHTPDPRTQELAPGDCAFARMVLCCFDGVVCALPAGGVALFQFNVVCASAVPSPLPTLLLALSRPGPARTPAAHVPSTTRVTASWTSSSVSGTGVATRSRPPEAAKDAVHGGGGREDAASQVHRITPSSPSPPSPCRCPLTSSPPHLGGA